MSLTRNAERIPLTKITPGKSWPGLRCSMATPVIHSKKPDRCRLATISIIEKSSTRVVKSTLSMACLGVSTPQTNMRTAPITAIAGRSILVSGNLPMAKTR